MTNIFDNFIMIIAAMMVIVYLGLTISMFIDLIKLLKLEKKLE